MVKICLNFKVPVSKEATANANVKKANIKVYSHLIFYLAQSQFHHNSTIPNKWDNKPFAEFPQFGESGVGG